MHAWSVARPPAASQRYLAPDSASHHWLLTSLAQHVLPRQMLPTGSDRRKSSAQTSGVGIFLGLKRLPTRPSCHRALQPKQFPFELVFNDPAWVCGELAYLVRVPKHGDKAFIIGKSSLSHECRQSSCYQPFVLTNVCKIVSSPLVRYYLPGLQRLGLL